MKREFDLTRAFNRREFGLGEKHQFTVKYECLGDEEGLHSEHETIFFPIFYKQLADHIKAGILYLARFNKTNEIVIVNAHVKQREYDIMDEVSKLSFRNILLDFGTIHRVEVYMPFRCNPIVSSIYNERFGYTHMNEQEIESHFEANFKGVSL